MNVALKLHTNGTNEIIDMPKKVRFNVYAKTIGCEWIEIVRPVNLPKGIVLVCDEEAKIRTKHPIINFQASWAYNMQEHGEPICGDCIVMKEVMGDEGAELESLSFGEAYELRKWFDTITPIAASILGYKLRMKKMLWKSE